MSDHHNEIKNRGIRMPNWVWEALEEKAKDDGRSVTSFVNVILKNYLDERGVSKPE